ncbi:MAG: Asp-tRNA(Asn)/Glu-tRNA(Gln) amidotransferase subunit GatA [Methanobacteriaceae archaeon]|jgi:aspartyl-tRNA(Asn)/glutamyl-tRNA(Gln) amidotransferase subunit A|uniref:Asp-tRNA(Asn)/Glu-tRNA(Gln) amidotransferase subunit GatA n=1 Tax=unclassified Methanobrevibacter TaxID=2638681 RepID=UPI0037678042|nr:Asp-tRNA(Asn)/Glu-tRNA(Gln) amidotransferase subunit GatA [Methanobacteriaceae archaeon]MDD4594857.1 Asp-tRNA(Asn)/Glu-tRNA(Gln) amidotransferase subunit GatA [Methanobacteriaceae archaeon]
MNIIEKLNSIKKQELTAQENLENYLKIIDEKNNEINAFIYINKEDALNKAKEIDEKIDNGKKVGSLAGLVFGIKANINVEDKIISAASKTLDNYIGSYDATVIKKIKEADGIIIGITNMDEFAAGSSTETSMYGTTNNPAALGRIPGGSSGGSAAAVSANMCDISIGSDTGGSIRNPASHCGVIGFKPTYGAVSRQGLLDLAMSLDQIGPMSNDITGIALALDTIISYDPSECTTLKWDSPNFTEIATNQKGNKPLEGMKIAKCKQFSDITDAEINKIIDESIGKLEELGAEIIEINFNYIDLCLPTYYLINYVEFFSATRKYDGRKYGHRIEEVCGDEVLRRIKMGSYISQKEFSGKYYKKALQSRSLIRNNINEILEDVDLIVGPTVPKLPHKIGEKLTPMEMYAYDTLTVIANLAGIPAGSIKAGEVEGIPVGLQLQAKPLDDGKIIKVMAALENN